MGLHEKLRHSKSFIDSSHVYIVKFLVIYSEFSEMRGFYDDLKSNKKVYFTLKCFISRNIGSFGKAYNYL